jgi:hypothetical protein
MAQHPESLKVKAGEPGSQQDRFSMNYINQGDDFESAVTYMVGHLNNDLDKADLRFPRVPDKKQVSFQ